MMVDSQRQLGSPLFFGVIFCRHTASAPITAGKHTGGVQ